MIDEISNSQPFGFHEDDLKLIICGIYPWNSTCQHTQHLQVLVMTRYAAHPSTQHLNEFLVKIASRMSRTGKTDRTPNYYLIASNVFLTESIDGGLEEEEDDEADNGQGGFRYKRKRGHSKGINKLMAIKSAPKKLKLIMLNAVI